MKKETYLRKLASIKLTDENTLGEAKEAKKVKNELERFWKKEAITYVMNNDDEAKRLMGFPDTKVVVDFNLKLAGTLKVKLIKSGTDLPYQPYSQEIKSYSIRKATLLT